MKKILMIVAIASLSACGSTGSVHEYDRPSGLFTIDHRLQWLGPSDKYAVDIDYGDGLILPAGTFDSKPKGVDNSEHLLGRDINQPVASAPPIQ